MRTAIQGKEGALGRFWLAGSELVWTLSATGGIGPYLAATVGAGSAPRPPRAPVKRDSPAPPTRE
jgi:hypothetical protein